MYPEWKAQQKILWAEVWKKGGGESRCNIQGFPANERCSQAVLDFRSGCGKAGPG